MKKITKKFLIEEALKKYTNKRLEEASWWTYIALFKDWLKMEWNFNLYNRWNKSKKEKIKTHIRSDLLNRTPNEENKRLNYDTSSENIVSISIRLKYK
jgi:hypothetical protein